MITCDIVMEPRPNNLFIVMQIVFLIKVHSPLMEDTNCSFQLQTRITVERVLTSGVCGVEACCTGKDLD